MQKILTATGNTNFNEMLKKEEDFYVYEQDIQYKEAIIDILEKDKNFNFLVIYENLPGEISKEDLTEKIKKINNKIKIIFILENKKINYEKIISKILNNKNNYNYYNKSNNKLNKNSKIIILFNNKKIIINKSFKFLENKKILILDFNNKVLNNKNNYYKKINKNIIFYNINLFIKQNKNNLKNAVNSIFQNFLRKYNIVLINFNYNKNNNYLENYSLKLSEKIIINSELNNIKKIKEIKNLINKLNLKYSIKNNKINILLNNYNFNSINYKIIKNIFEENKIIKLNKKILKKGFENGIRKST